MEASSDQVRPDTVQVPAWAVREDGLNRDEERGAASQMRVPVISGLISLASILAGLVWRAVT
jgi:hypothetical protein